MLPYHIEKVLALQHAHGEPIVWMNTIQNIPVGGVAAGAAVRTSRTPRQGVYAAIYFRMLVGSNVVPNVFNLYMMHRGQVLYNAAVGTTLVDHGLFFLKIITSAQALIEIVTNTAAVAQYWEQTYDLVEVSNEEVLKQVLAILEAA